MIYNSMSYKYFYGFGDMLIGSKIPPQADIIKFVIADGDPRVAVRGVTHLPFLETADVNPLNTTRREENSTGILFFSSKCI